MASQTDSSSVEPCILFFIQTLPRMLSRLCVGAISRVSFLDLFGPIAGAINPIMQSLLRRISQLYLACMVTRKRFLFHQKARFLQVSEAGSFSNFIMGRPGIYITSGVSHSDGSCVLGRIHSDVSSNIPKKVYHIVTDNFVNLLHISYA